MKRLYLQLPMIVCIGPSVSASGEFQEVEGESAERRKARWERYQRTAERTVSFFHRFVFHKLTGR
ncbi:hypothetical protein KP509_22G037600 [Ceratopteris richardii]|uniref:Secreted protein n=1 Tax=Ceratopteris richardii TaxID=49495 RepID=A0A8T2S7B4_CERRI|nr:hypothetical protein KP509_22G037600 [Ceratopteris richardii]